MLPYTLYGGAEPVVRCVFQDKFPNGFQRQRLPARGCGIVAVAPVCTYIFVIDGYHHWHGDCGYDGDDDNDDDYGTVPVYNCVMNCDHNYYQI